MRGYVRGWKGYGWADRGMRVCGFAGFARCGLWDAKVANVANVANVAKVREDANVTS